MRAARPSTRTPCLIHFRRLATHAAVALLAVLVWSHLASGGALDALPLVVRGGVMGADKTLSARATRAAERAPPPPPPPPPGVTRSCAPPLDVLEKTTARACAACAPVPVPLVHAQGAWRVRGSGAQFDEYVRLAMRDEIAGFSEQPPAWLRLRTTSVPLPSNPFQPAVNFPTVTAFAVLARAQAEAGVTGSVGEIGVHHGRACILAALLAAPAEPLWALDLFNELQHLNVDRSGHGDRAALEANMRAVGLNASAAALSIVGSSSFDWAPRDFCAASLPKFRWFSVDGGHTEAATRHDLHLGACHLADGGILAVDDVFNDLFLGVTEGIFNFIAANRERIAPFFKITGKLYFTTPSHHARYLAHLEAFYVGDRYNTYTDPEKTIIAGWRVVSHSVPIHADIESRPDKGPRLNVELREVLGAAAGAWPVL